MEGIGQGGRGWSSPERRCGVEAVEDAWAAAFIGGGGGGGALVASGDGGTTLQCQCGRRKVRAASNGDNGGRWKGLIMKRRRRWRSDENRSGGEGLWQWKPVRWTRRRCRRRGT
jgi:hypothetical protein